MKGMIDLTLGNVVRLILVVVAVVFFMQFLYAGEGGLKGVIEDLCLKNPAICGIDQTTTAGGAAVFSTKALVCAVNTVGSGNEQGCLAEYTDDTGGPLVECGETDGVVFETLYYTRVYYGQTELSGDVPGEPKTWYFEEAKKDAEQKCKKYGKDVKAVDRDAIGSNVVQEIFDCVGTGQSCKVKNFQLPQETGNWEEWIRYRGDPRYIVYWQNFPIEEDTWTFTPDWKWHVAIAVVSAVPVGRVFGIGLKTLKAGFVGPGKTVAAKAFKQTLGRKLAMAATGGVTESIEELTRAELKAAVKMAGKRYVAKEYFKIAMKDAVIERLAGKLALEKTAARFLFLETGMRIADLVDSVFKKFDPQPNQIAIASPYRTLTTFELADETKGKPVMVKWTPEEFTEIKQAHLVSPCHLKEFNVKKETMFCDSYGIDLVNKTVQCSGAEVKNKIENPCGFYGEGIDNYFEADVYRKTQEIIKKNRYVFENDEKNDKTNKIHLFYHSTPENPVYLTDLKDTEKEDWVKGWAHIGTHDVLNTTLHLPEQTKLVPVNSESELVMIKGRYYVLHIYGFKENLGKDDVVVDIYSVDTCKTKEIKKSPTKDTQGNLVYSTFFDYPDNLDCQQVLNTTETVDSVEEIKNLVKDAYENEKEYVRKFWVNSTTEAREILNKDFNLGTEDNKCGGTQFSSVECLRVTETVPEKKKDVNLFCRTFTKHEAQQAENETTEGKQDSEFCECRLMNKAIEELDQLETIYPLGGGRLETVTEEKGIEKYNFKCIVENGERIFYSSEYRLYPEAKPMTFIVIDDALDGVWNSLTVSNQLFRGDPTHMIALNDFEGNAPMHVSTTNCDTDAIVLDMGKLAEKKIEDKDPNYCLRYLSAGQVGLKWAGRVVAVTGLVVSALFTGGGSLLATTLIVGGTGAFEAGTEIYTGKKLYWPG